MLVWTHITQGEHLFAPLMLADRQTAGPCTQFALDVHQAWYKSRTGRRGRHWFDLRQALDSYADQLAARIDAGQPLELA